MRTYPVNVKDRKTGEQWNGYTVRGVVVRAYGRGATAGPATTVGPNTTLHTVTGPLDRRANARPVLAEVIIRWETAR